MLNFSFSHSACYYCCCCRGTGYFESIWNKRISVAFSKKLWHKPALNHKTQNKMHSTFACFAWRQFVPSDFLISYVVFVKEKNAILTRDKLLYAYLIFLRGMIYDDFFAIHICMTVRRQLRCLKIIVNVETRFKRFSRELFFFRQSRLPLFPDRSKALT